MNQVIVPDVARLGSLRKELTSMLGIPAERCALDPEPRGSIESQGVLIEKWIWTTEPGSSVPALVYRPQKPAGKLPAIVLTYGHGGSKSSWQYNYAGLLYAKLGLACVAIDPLGEEERNIRGETATRAHDPKEVSDRADAAGRLIMGKFVFDTMRSIDYLQTRDDIDSDRIGIAGNSLGGATAGWVAALEPRLRMALVCGWAFDDITIPTKWCTRLPNERMRALCSWEEYAALPGPRCAMLLMNGDADEIIDQGGTGQAWRGTRDAVAGAAEIHQSLGGQGRVAAWFEPSGGHRPYFLYKRALEWVHEHLGTPAMSLRQIRALPEVNSGDWCDRNGVVLEKLYGTDLHQRGASLAHLGIQRIPATELAVLRADELGNPQYTLEGWLDRIERNA